MPTILFISLNFNVIFQTEIGFGFEMLLDPRTLSITEYFFQIFLYFIK